MSTLIPYERRARPAKYHDVGTRSPRGHAVHAAQLRWSYGGCVDGVLRLASPQPSDDRRHSSIARVLNGLVLSTFASRLGFRPQASKSSAVKHQMPF